VRWIVVRGLFRHLFSLLGLGLVRHRDLTQIPLLADEHSNLRHKSKFYGRNNAQFNAHGIGLELLINSSKSENGQDLFAILATGFRKNLTLLEIDAYDGVTFSNSFFLEKEYSWSGLLVECVPESFEKIGQARGAKGIFAAATEFDEEAVEVYQSPAANLSSLLG
jgi:hypothetical protein